MAFCLLISFMICLFESIKCSCQNPIQSHMHQRGYLSLSQEDQLMILSLVQIKLPTQPPLMTWLITPTSSPSGLRQSLVADIPLRSCSLEKHGLKNTLTLGRQTHRHNCIAEVMYFQASRKIPSQHRWGQHCHPHYA